MSCFESGALTPLGYEMRSGASCDFAVGTLKRPLSVQDVECYFFPRMNVCGVRWRLAGRLLRSGSEVLTGIVAGRKEAVGVSGCKNRFHIVCGSQDTHSKKVARTYVANHRERSRDSRKEKRTCGDATSPSSLTSAARIGLTGVETVWRSSGGRANPVKHEACYSVRSLENSDSGAVGQPRATQNARIAVVGRWEPGHSHWRCE